MTVKELKYFLDFFDEESKVVMEDPVTETEHEDIVVDENIDNLTIIIRKKRLYEYEK